MLRAKYSVIITLPHPCFPEKLGFSISTFFTKQDQHLWVQSALFTSTSPSEGFGQTAQTWKGVRRKETTLMSSTSSSKCVFSPYLWRSFTGLIWLHVLCATIIIRSPGIKWKTVETIVPAVCSKHNSNVSFSDQMSTANSCGSNANFCWQSPSFFTWWWQSSGSTINTWHEVLSPPSSSRPLL